MFHHRQGHPIKISLLKSSLADHRLWNLSGDRHKRDGVHVRVGDAGDEVGGAGATGGHADTGLAGGSGVPLSGENPALFVPGQDGANLLGAGQRLMELHAGAARVGKDCVHALALKRPDEDFAAKQAWPQLTLGFCLRIRLCFSCFAHFLCAVGCKKKPTTGLVVGFLEIRCYSQQAPDRSGTTTTSSTSTAVTTSIAINGRIRSVQAPGRQAVNSPFRLAKRLALGLFLSLSRGFWFGGFLCRFLSRLRFAIGDL